MADYNIVFKGNQQELKDLVDALQIREKLDVLHTLDDKIRQAQENLELTERTKAEAEKELSKLRSDASDLRQEVSSLKMKREEFRQWAQGGEKT